MKERRKANPNHLNNHQPSPEEKTRLTIEMTEAVTAICADGIRANNPDITEEEVITELRRRIRGDSSYSKVKTCSQCIHHHTCVYTRAVYELYDELSGIMFPYAQTKFGEFAEPLAEFCNYYNYSQPTVKEEG